MRKKPSKKTMRRRLDNVVRDYVKLRDQNVCQTCFIHKDSTPQQSLDWSHYISRRYSILRYDQRNGLAMCRKCHNQYGDGFNSPMQKAIDRIWGDGTVAKLEKIAMQYPSIKGTPLDTVDFRLELEDYYKQLIKYLEKGIPPDEVMNAVESSWGMEIENCLQGEI